MDEVEVRTLSAEEVELVSGGNLKTQAALVNAAHDQLQGYINTVGSWLSWVARQI